MFRKHVVVAIGTALTSEMTSWRLIMTYTDVTCMTPMTSNDDAINGDVNGRQPVPPTFNLYQFPDALAIHAQ